MVSGGRHHVLGRVNHCQKRTLEIALPQATDAVTQEPGGQPADVRQLPGDRVVADDLQRPCLPQGGQLRVSQPQPAAGGFKVQAGQQYLKS